MDKDVAVAMVQSTAHAATQSPLGDWVWIICTKEWFFKVPQTIRESKDVSSHCTGPTEHPKIHLPVCHSGSASLWLRPRRTGAAAGRWGWRQCRAPWRMQGPSPALGSSSGSPEGYRTERIRWLCTGSLQNTNTGHLRRRFLIIHSSCVDEENPVLLLIANTTGRSRFSHYEARPWPWVGLGGTLQQLERGSAFSWWHWREENQAPLQIGAPPDGQGSVKRWWLPARGRLPTGHQAFCARWNNFVQISPAVEREGGTRVPTRCFRKTRGGERIYRVMDDWTARKRFVNRGCDSCRGWNEQSLKA